MCVSSTAEVCEAVALADQSFRVGVAVDVQRFSVVHHLTWGYGIRLEPWEVYTILSRDTRRFPSRLRIKLSLFVINVRLLSSLLLYYPCKYVCILICILINTIIITHYFSFFHSKNIYRGFKSNMKI